MSKLGATYDEDRDGDRIRRQRGRVWAAMHRAGWRTLYWIGEQTGDPVQSVSARLRDFRKEAFGGHVVKRRRTGAPGEWEYLMIARQRAAR